MVALKDKLDLNECRLMVVYQRESEELDHKCLMKKTAPEQSSPKLKTRYRTGIGIKGKSPCQGNEHDLCLRMNKFLDRRLKNISGNFIKGKGCDVIFNSRYLL